MNSQYSGTMIKGLHAMTACAEQGTALPLHSEPSGDWKEIAALRVKIAEAMFDKEGNCVPHFEILLNAYFDLAKVQDCLMHGTTELCARCGQMEGMHRMGTFCELPPSLNDATKVSSPVFVSKAVIK